jgi:site-specific DNA-methyltransferase (adenine-specific)
VTIDLRLGRWQDVLADVECDALICDPPYSERTHSGQRSQESGVGRGDPGQSSVEYAHLTESDVVELIQSWTPRCKRWFVMFGDDVTTRWAKEALDAAGWYAFHPIPWVKPDASPRICGDGPSSQSESIAIGRPRRRMYSPELRFRPGFYDTGMARGGFVGSKPINLIRALVRDYSEPGDLVADCFAGTGTTLLAAITEGRRAVGAECLPAHYEIARKRLAKGYTPSLFTEPAREMKQAELVGVSEDAVAAHEQDIRTWGE